MMIRLDRPGDGVAVVGSFPMGDEARGLVSLHLYGDEATGLAETELPTWTAWLADLLQDEIAT